MGEIIIATNAPIVALKQIGYLVYLTLDALEAILLITIEERKIIITI